MSANEKESSPTMATPTRHPNSARFHQIIQELGELHDRKQADYGKDNDPFSNVRSTEEWGISPWMGAFIRLNDKIKRLQSLARKGKLSNECAEDSMRDIAVYAIIGLVLYEQEMAHVTADAGASPDHPPHYGADETIPCAACGMDQATLSSVIKEYACPSCEGRTYR